MDLTPNDTNTTTKSRESEPDIPTRMQPFGNALSFSNVVLQPQPPLPPPPPPPPQPDVFTYKECLKNHAASLGRYALDGCGEFMPSSEASDSASLKCAACGCHRNFHRRDPDELPMPVAPPTAPPTAQVIGYQPYPLHQAPPPPPPPPPRSPESATTPLIPPSYYGGHQPNHHPYRQQLSAPPHMLLSLSTHAPPETSYRPPPSSVAAMFSSISRKRYRTKFTDAQKSHMFDFAERFGWKLPRRDEGTIREFCYRIGVERDVLKVWMHNNKNTLGKRPQSGNDPNIQSTQNNNATPTASHLMMKNEPNGEVHHHNHSHHHHFGTKGSNGSSNSS
ncbi:hypothetical protein SAY87_007946 [Trapa incisa]|uniref:ZF-HD dimerization-type domain-containing protein n=1 Tax=Trapa incisa TaxID=236973 RepID=A0AAN7KJE0_9MYRT|nr:hypothetical protein SAY87_007946 [Trapa incisa]